jgi:hypothetical protein
VSNKTTPGCPPVQVERGAKDPRIRELLVAEKTPMMQAKRSVATSVGRRILRFMENNYTLTGSIVRNVRIAQEKVFQKTKNLLLYNFCIRMYLFEVSVFGIHIAPTWYGLMYALGFIFCYLFVGKYSRVAKSDMDNLLLYIFLGVILG